MDWNGRLLLDSANALLGRLGFRIEHTRLDFDARIESADHLAHLFRGLAEPVSGWLATQRLFEIRDHFDIEREVANFYHEYLKMPFRGQSGGSRFNNQLWLTLIAKSRRPSVIIDSGTYTGASAWALQRGAPDAVLYSCDINLRNLRWRSPQVRYIGHDWTDLDLSLHNTLDGMAYFDDHIDQARRLLEAAECGFRFAIFDDDFPLTSFAAMAYGGTTLPKIEMVLDEKLMHGEEIVWTERGHSYSWQVDRAYLDRARAVIAAADRLPNTSLVTGIHQTPYRVVAMRPLAAS